MIQRYLAFVRQPGSDEEPVVRELRQALAGSTTAWQLEVDEVGLLVAQSGSATGNTHVYPLVLEPGRPAPGVVLGKLFPRHFTDRYEPNDAPPSDPSLSPGECQRIITSEGRHLVSHYWGRYVAFVLDAASGARHVLRDPSGALPCYFAAYRGVEVYFSHVEDWEEVVSGALSINWDHIGRHLHFELTQQSDTGLNEVRALLPGHCRTTATRGSQVRDYWRIVDLAGAPAIEDAGEAAAALLRTTTACVAAWASCYRHIVHRLSGGLDSTVVLGALERAKTRAEISCLHFHSESIDGEERRFAAAAARFSGVRLHFQRLGVTSLAPAEMARMPKTALPMAYYYGLSASDLEAHLAEEVDADAFFSGHGGDEVFNATMQPYGAVDYLMRHGLGSSWVEVSMDAARLSRTSLWSVLRSLFDVAVRRRQCDPLADAREMRKDTALTASLRDSLRLTDIMHPSLHDCTLPPGKLLHAFAIHVPYTNAMLAPRENLLDHVHPLRSQPLVELCLRIPVYLLHAGGRNRGLVRRAFKNVIAREVVTRDAKASGDGHDRVIARHNAEILADYLLAGRLVENGLLDRAVLEQTLVGDRARVYAYASQLLSFLFTEDWVRRWA